MENKEQSSDVKIKEVIRKLDRKALWIGVTGLIVLLAFPIWITDHFWFDYSKTGTFGDTIGGLTAPIIGLISALLIYLSFRAQIKANYIVQGQIEKQEETENEKKKIEFINNLFLQLRDEINEFEFTKYSGPLVGMNPEKFNGIEAFTNYFEHINKYYDHYCQNEDVFLNDTKNQQYLGLLGIADNLIQIITDSKLKSLDLVYFKNKLQYLFDYKLTLNPDQRIILCKYCGEDHLQIPCLLTRKIRLLEAKIDFLVD